MLDQPLPHRPGETIEQTPPKNLEAAASDVMPGVASSPATAAANSSSENPIVKISRMNPPARDCRFGDSIMHVFSMTYGNRPALKVKDAQSTHSYCHNRSILRMQDGAKSGT
jgi:hypothetical protein